MKSMKLPLICTFGLSLLFTTTPTESSQRSCNGGRSHKSGKGCEERFNKFLHDVLHARDNLVWIDQVAYQMHSSKLLHANPDLEERLNAMFYNSEQRVWAPQKDTNVIIPKRYRRHSKQTDKSLPKSNDASNAYNENVLANKKNSNSPKYEYNADSLLQRNFNSTMESTQKIRTKNGIATTADPLEKILQSINVFPVEDDRDARGAYEFNDDAAENDFQLGLFKQKTVGVSSGNESFGGKHTRMRRSLKSSSSDADIILDNIIELPKSEYDADKVQNKKAINGDLAKEIVDAIFDKLKVRGGFNVPISQYYTLAVNSRHAENAKREKNKLTPTNGNDIFPNKIMTSIQELISEEVEKKSCATLQPELHHFLEWLIDNDIDNNEYVNLLGENTASIIESKPSKTNSIVSLGEWYEKAASLKQLLNEYDGLSRKEKNKVQAIYEYLASRYAFVEAYIKAFEAHEIAIDQLLKIRIK